MTENNVRSTGGSRASVGVSDRGLRAFLAAVDSGSITRAAAQLGIGQSAVSHAIARLEAALEVTLLERDRDGVRPTAPGSRLAEQLAPAFAVVDGAVADVIADGDAAPVTVSVSTSLAAYWLTPRLPDFKQAHPGLELRVITTDTDNAVGVDGADLWIPLGVVERPDLEAISFCEERIVPVAAPNLAAELAGASPSDLVEAPLLHLEERYSPRYDWHRWFAAHGVDLGSGGELTGHRSNDYSLILHAALAGAGVALGWQHIVGELVERGDLVAVGAEVETGSVFPILARKDRALSVGASEFRDWLLGNAPGK